jgi:hypothetical protein
MGETETLEELRLGFFVVLTALGFELRASHLLGSHSTLEPLHQLRLLLLFCGLSCNPILRLLS